MFLDFPTVYTDGGFQITVFIGETAESQSKNPVIKTGCFPKGICANVVLSAVAGRMFYHISIFRFSIASKWESLVINVRAYC